MRDWTMSLLAGTALTIAVAISACASHNEPTPEPIPDWYQGIRQPEPSGEGFLFRTARRAEMPNPKIYGPPPAAESPAPYPAPEAPDGPAPAPRRPMPDDRRVEQASDRETIASGLSHVFTWTVMHGPVCLPTRLH